MWFKIIDHWAAGWVENACGISISKTSQAVLWRFYFKIPSIKTVCDDGNKFGLVSFKEVIQWRSIYFLLHYHWQFQSVYNQKINMKEILQYKKEWNNRKIIYLRMEICNWMCKKYWEAMLMLRRELLIHLIVEKDTA